MRERALSAAEKVQALAVKRAIEAAGGLERCAAETGKSTSQLSRCGSAEHADSLTIRDAATIDALGDGTRGAPFILNALAREQGMLLIDGPGRVDDPDGIQATVVEMTCELGDVATSVRTALADGKWSEREVRDALHQLDDLDAVSAKLRAGLMGELSRLGGQ